MEVGAADGGIEGAEEWARHCLALDGSDVGGYGEGVEGLETSVASAQVRLNNLLTPPNYIVTPLNSLITPPNKPMNTSSSPQRSITWMSP